MDAQTGFDVAHVLVESQLREGRAEKLIEVGKRLGGIFGRSMLHTAAVRVKG